MTRIDEFSVSIVLLGFPNCRIFLCCSKLMLLSVVRFHPKPPTFMRPIVFFESWGVSTFPHPFLQKFSNLHCQGVKKWLKRKI